ncbi:Uncharacterised protein [uncultured archaeon]|nr:Uncharacterised protein [uncultured archaeon]
MPLKKTFKEFSDETTALVNKQNLAFFEMAKEEYDKLKAIEPLVKAIKKKYPVESNKVCNIFSKYESFIGFVITFGCFPDDYHPDLQWNTRFERFVQENWRNNLLKECGALKARIKDELLDKLCNAVLLLRE